MRALTSGPLGESPCASNRIVSRLRVAAFASQLSRARASWLAPQSPRGDATRAAAVPCQQERVRDDTPLLGPTGELSAAPAALTSSLSGHLSHVFSGLWYHTHNASFFACTDAAATSNSAPRPEHDRDNIRAFLEQEAVCDEHHVEAGVLGHTLMLARVGSRRAL